MSDLQSYVSGIRACQLCAGQMQRAPNPILQVSETATILIAGQAPGNLADKTSKPFNDPSGVRLRAWMGIGEGIFYDPSQVAIVPMGFCFPGYDKNGGDLPPMKRCAEEWREGLLKRLPNVQLTLLIGAYAQRWHLKEKAAKTLTATVQNWREHLCEGLLTLPHPSWRNNGWLKKNPWFEKDLCPELQARVQACLRSA